MRQEVVKMGHLHFLLPPIFCRSINIRKDSLVRTRFAFQAFRSPCIALNAQVRVVHRIFLICSRSYLPKGRGYNTSLPLNDANQTSPLQPSMHLVQSPDIGTTFLERLNFPVASLAFGLLRFPILFTPLNISPNSFI